MKRKSNKLELLLVLVLVLTLVPIGNCNVMAEGESGDATNLSSNLANEVWQESDFEVAGSTINGFTNAGKEKLKAKDGHLEFPSAMANIIIGNSAFAGNKDLKSFSWGNIVRIEASAFKECSLEGELAVPDGFAWIGNEAFRGNKLTKVVFPDDIKTVGPLAFAENQIEEVDLGKLTRIEGSRWADELNIENKGLISYYLFYDNRIKQLIIPEDAKVWGLGVGAFAKNDIETLYIPDVIHNIYAHAFNENKNLREVTIVYNGIQIDQGAFQDCAIEKLKLPDEVNQFGGNAFAGNQIKHLKLPEKGVGFGFHCFDGNPIEKLEGLNPKSWLFEFGAFDNTKTLKNISFKFFDVTKRNDLVYRTFSNGKLRSLEIKPGITRIAEGAFKDNEGWYKGTKKVALYRTKQAGEENPKEYDLTNSIDDKRNQTFAFNPVLLEIKITDQDEKGLELANPLKIKRKRIDKNGTEKIEDLELEVKEDYDNFKLGDKLEIEIPDFGEKIKFKSTNAHKEGNIYTLSLDPKDVYVKDVKYGDGYEVGYKKATLEIKYSKPRDIAVEVQWKDSDDKVLKEDDQPADGIKINLTKKNTKGEFEIINGKHILLEKNKGWKGEFEKLDVNESNGTPINYGIEKPFVLGYKTVVTGNQVKGFVIVNSKEGNSHKPKEPKPEEPKPEEPKPEELKPEELKPEEPKPEPEVKPDIKPEPVPNPIPNNPRPAYERNSIPDPNDPSSPEQITLIDENGVPLGNYIKQGKPDGTMEYVIMEEEVPLANLLPKTGENYIYVIGGLGIVLMALGLLLFLIDIRKRKN